MARATIIGMLAGTTTLLGPSTPAFAAWVGPAKALTSSSWDNRTPDISGTKVAYADYRYAHDVGDPNDPDTLFDVRVRDLKTGKVTLLTPKHDAYSAPQISGNRVIWTSSNGKKLTMWYHNLATGTHKKLPFTSGEYRISGSRICYSGFSGTWRVYVYDLATGRSKVVSPKGMDADACDISGTNVVWQTSTGAPNFAIYSYNLSTKKLTAVTDGAAGAALPRIDGKYIVWWDDRNGLLNDDIFLYDLSTHTETQVTTADGDQWFPALSGGRIVYCDDRPGSAGVYLYDVATGIESPVTDPGGAAWNLAISGNRIVYQDDSGDKARVYLRTITPPVVKISAPASVPKGVAPLISGTLKAADGTPVVNAVVRLQYSTNGTTWATGGSALTSVAGAFSVAGPAITKATYFRVAFPGNPDFAPAVSSKHKVKVT